MTLDGDLARARDTIRQLEFQRADRDRVIARLLDGWLPVAGDTHRVWTDPFCVKEAEPMSDGEAAIIRAHQEKDR